MSNNSFLNKISRFFGPGYVITLSVNDVDKTILDKVIDTLKAKGFILVQEGPHPVRHAYLIASYLKSLSSERNDCIFATCHYPKTEYPEKRLENLWLIMQNEVRGREPAIKSIMDELGDSLLTDLSNYVSKENIIVTRRNTSPSSG